MVGLRNFNASYNFCSPIDKKNSGNYSLTPDPKHRLTGLETDMPKTICYYSTNFFKCNYRLGRMETNVSCLSPFFVHTSNLTNESGNGLSPVSMHQFQTLFIKVS